MNRTVRVILFLSLAACGGPAAGQEEPAEPAEPTDLTVTNLLTDGWSTDLQKRSGAGRAVRVPLFRTRQAFLFREIRFDYLFAPNADYGQGDQHLIEGEVLSAPNRRFQYGVFPEYEWLEGADGRFRHAGFWGFGNRVQLVDTRDAALNIAYRVRTPRGKEFDDERTRFSLILAGFRDVGNRVGVQAHIEGDFLAGPNRQGRARREVTYATAVTKTVTEENVFPAELTLFLEAYGRTEVDGRSAGRTGVALLPGARFMVTKDWFLAAGVEIPLAGPRPYDYTVHVSVRREF